MACVDHCDYVADYSVLGGYQQAHRQIYSVQKLQSGARLRVEQVCESGRKWSSCLTALPYREACKLMLYLFENRVPLENWMDIVADYEVPVSEVKAGA